MSLHAELPITTSTALPVHDRAGQSCSATPVSTFRCARCTPRSVDTPTYRQFRCCRLCPVAVGQRDTRTPATPATERPTAVRLRTTTSGPGPVVPRGLHPSRDGQYRSCSASSWREVDLFSVQAATPAHVLARGPCYLQCKPVVRVVCDNRGIKRRVCLVDDNLDYRIGQ